MADMGTAGTAQVEVQLAEAFADCPGEGQIAAWARRLLAPEHGDLCIRVVGAEEGAALNAAYRGRDYATNVLSFPAGELPDDCAPILGDLVICAPVLAREAAEYGRVLTAHYAHMVIHGVLHLLGYDHEEEDDARRMEARESELMNELGFKDPWAQ